MRSCSSPMASSAPVRSSFSSMTRRFADSKLAATMGCVVDLGFVSSSSSKKPRALEAGAGADFQVVVFKHMHAGLAFLHLSWISTSFTTCIHIYTALLLLTPRFFLPLARPKSPEPTFWSQLLTPFVLCAKIILHLWALPPNHASKIVSRVNGNGSVKTETLPRTNEKTDVSREACGDPPVSLNTWLCPAQRCVFFAFRSESVFRPPHSAAVGCLIDQGERNHQWIGAVRYRYRALRPDVILSLEPPHPSQATRASLSKTLISVISRPVIYMFLSDWPLLLTQSRPCPSKIILRMNRDSTDLMSMGLAFPEAGSHFCFSHVRVGEHVQRKETQDCSHLLKLIWRLLACSVSSCLGLRLHSERCRTKQAYFPRRFQRRISKGQGRPTKCASIVRMIRCVRTNPVHIAVTHTCSSFVASQALEKTMQSFWFVYGILPADFLRVLLLPNKDHSSRTSNQWPPPCEQHAKAQACTGAKEGNVGLWQTKPQQINSPPGFALKWGGPCYCAGCRDTAPPFVPGWRN